MSTDEKTSLSEGGADVCRGQRVPESRAVLQVLAGRRWDSAGELTPSFHVHPDGVLLSRQSNSIFSLYRFRVEFHPRSKTHSRALHLGVASDSASGLSRGALRCRHWPFCTRTTWCTWTSSRTTSSSTSWDVSSSETWAAPPTSTSSACSATSATCRSTVWRTRWCRSETFSVWVSSPINSCPRRISPCLGTDGSLCARRTGFAVFSAF